MINFGQKAEGQVAEERLRGLAEASLSTAFGRVGYLVLFHAIIRFATIFCSVYFILLVKCVTTGA